MTEGWCVGCKMGREIHDPETVEFRKRGGAEGKAVKGVCPSCGKGMWRFVG